MGQLASATLQLEEESSEDEKGLELVLEIVWEMKRNSAGPVVHKECLERV